MDQKKLHKVTIKNANFFVPIVSCLHTHQQKTSPEKTPHLDNFTQCYNMLLDIVFIYFGISYSKKYLKRTCSAQSF